MYSISLAFYTTVYKKILTFKFLLTVKIPLIKNKSKNIRGSIKIVSERQIWCDALYKHQMCKRIRYIIYRCRHMGPSLQSFRVLIFLGKKGKTWRSGSPTQEPFPSGCISLKIKSILEKKAEANMAKYRLTIFDEFGRSYSVYNHSLIRISLKCQTV